MLIQAIKKFMKKIEVATLNIVKFKFIQLSAEDTTFKMRNGWFFKPTRINIFEPWVIGEVFSSTQDLSDNKPKYVGVSIHMSGYMLGYDDRMTKQNKHPYDLVDIIK